MQTLKTGPELTGLERDKSPASLLLRDKQKDSRFVCCSVYFLMTPQQSICDFVKELLNVFFHDSVLATCETWLGYNFSWVDWCVATGGVALVRNYISYIIYIRAPTTKYII